MRDSLLDEMDLYPYADGGGKGGDRFNAPQTSKSYENVLDHIEQKLQVSECYE